MTKLHRKSLVMGKCIKIIKDKIDVSKVIKQLEKYPEDWGSQQKLENVELKDPHTHITSVDVLQLIMGGIEKPGQLVGDSEICTKTPAYQHHSEIRKILKKNLVVKKFIGVDFFLFRLMRLSEHILMKELIILQEIVIIYQYREDINTLLETKLL